MVPVTRQEISPVAGMPYKDVDVTAYVDPGNTAGVMLEIINTSGATYYKWGVRKNGSGDTLENILMKIGHTWAAIGVDSNDVFEAYVENAAIKIYIVGYITNAEGGFLTNTVNKTVARDAAWHDINISGDTGGDTAICAFFLVQGSLGQSYGFRKNGSTDERKSQIYLSDNLHGAMMSVDGSEILEGFINGGVTISFYLVGWLTANMFDWANAKNYQTAPVGAWNETDFSPDIPAGNDGAFCHFFPTSAAMRYGGVRKLGSAFDDYKRISMHAYLWVEIDEDRKAEQKIEDLILDLWLWGYTQQPSTAPTAPTSPEVDGKSTPTGANCVTITPQFSAIFNDPDAGDISNAIEIQVGSASGLSDLWDSGWLVDSTVDGSRCNVKTYTGTSLSARTSYWWRCRFRDDSDTVGAWSSWQEFDICAAIGVAEKQPGGPVPKKRPFAQDIKQPVRRPVEIDHRIG